MPTTSSSPDAAGARKRSASSPGSDAGAPGTVTSTAPARPPSSRTTTSSGGSPFTRSSTEKRASVSAPSPTRRACRSSQRARTTIGAAAVSSANESGDSVSARPAAGARAVAANAATAAAARTAARPGATRTSVDLDAAREERHLAAPRGEQRVEPGRDRVPDRHREDRRRHGRLPAALGHAEPDDAGVEAGSDHGDERARLDAGPRDAEHDGASALEPDARRPEHDRLALGRDADRHQVHGRLRDRRQADVGECGLSDPHRDRLARGYERGGEQRDERCGKL